MTRTPVALLLLSITATLLASCNSASPATAPAPGAVPPITVTNPPVQSLPPNALPDPLVDHPGQVAPRFGFTAAMAIQSGDTVASMQAASGGTVLTWDDASGALIGLNANKDGTAPSASSLSASLGRAVAVDANRDQLGAGGTITAVMSGSKIAWAGGNLSAWSAGSKIAWAGGEYTPIPQNTQTWNAIHLQQAQTLAPNLGAGVVVAVIDTGLDLDHVAFKDALTDQSTWWDFYGGDAVPQDEGTLGTGGYGHGTNVAGIILQIAPKSKIMPLRVLGPDGSGDVSGIVSAINWAVAHGAKVINLSLGSATNVKPINDALLAAAAKKVLTVTSAGNNSRGTLTYPAQNRYQLPSLVSVASVDLMGLKSSFSNYGLATAVVAPGENVFAPAPGNMMASWSGTSQAAPMVAGGLALALGQTLKVPMMALPGAVSFSAANKIYTNSANWVYAAQLGSGELDLAALMSQTVK
ncbi:S8 family serine peptidase [Deinococcus sp.]|uniref:S8 family serine peptidase n=1 Tax=Deinococcus sp. TaxID=47478 RepID=UPI002869BBFF|nr:S8 family serine peptidase [Deinococcus sp.]